MSNTVRPGAPRDSDLEHILDRLRKQLARLVGSGENWRITINGSPRHVRLEVVTFESVDMTGGPEE